MNNMWKNWFGVMLSLWVTLLPFLGFPRGMKDIFYVLTGIVLIAIFFTIANDRVV